MRSNVIYQEQFEKLKNIGYFGSSKKITGTIILHHTCPKCNKEIIHKFLRNNFLNILQNKNSILLLCEDCLGV